MRITSAVIAAGLIAGLTTAASAETDGWYGGAEAGVNIVPTVRFDALANTWHQQQQAGYALLGQVGYGFGQVRLEGEVGWRQNGVNKFDNASGAQSPVSGNLDALSVMANAYYDFNTGTKWTPYLGFGLGGLDQTGDNITAGGTKIVNDSAFVFAYQGIAGLSYAVNDMLSLKGDYRYVRSEKASLNLDPQYGGAGSKNFYASHAFLIGFTMKFDQPAAPVAASAPMPPPPPAPTPAPAPKQVQAAPIPKNFMVFFDFDKDVLTPEAKSILTQAADAAKKQHSTTIDLTGYTDLAGSVQYNLKLSERRGEAAKKFLVSLGIPANEISVVGKGKSDPLVPTKDGVREAQNRRVQIVLE